MQDRIRNFFSAPLYEDDLEKTQDARTTHRVGIALLFLAVLSSFFTLLLKSPVREIVLGSTGFGFFIWLFTIYLVKTERLTAAKIIILIVNTFNLFGAVYAIGGMTLPTIYATLFLLALANLLFPRRGVTVYGGVLFILAAGIYMLDVSGLVPAPAMKTTSATIFQIYTFTIIAVTGMLAISSADARRILEAVRRNEDELRKRNMELNQLKLSLEERVAERTTQLETRANQLDAISSVARSTASLQNVEELLPIITILVSERFGYYHTGIFLIDQNREFAVLMAANSAGGQRMLERHHQLKLDMKSIVGYVTSLGEARIALDVGTDAVYFDNPDLPDTRSEMALPLRVGGRVIGALDVQSTKPSAFTEEDVSTLTILADQISIAIENARLFSESREALKESEETFGRYIKQEWSSFAQQVKNIGYIFDGKRTIPIGEAGKYEKVRSLPQTGRLSLEKPTGDLVIPIRMRGQTIGLLEVKSKSGSRKWTQDDLTLLEAAVERTALALENARLVESSQKRASREQTIGEISTRIGAVSNLDTIMQTAVEELGRRIGGVAEVTLELGREE